VKDHAERSSIFNLSCSHLFLFPSVPTKKLFTLTRLAMQQF